MDLRLRCPVPIENAVWVRTRVIGLEPLALAVRAGLRLRVECAHYVLSYDIAGFAAPEIPVSRCKI